MTRYKCNKCGKVVHRDSRRWRIKSICGDTGQMSKLKRVIW